MPEMPDGIITGIFGLSGTIIGGGLSFFAQMFYDYRRTRKNRRCYLIRVHEEIMYGILVMRNAIHSLLNFIKIDIRSLDDFAFEETYKNVNSSVEKCSLLWKKVWTVLIRYLPKITNHKKFSLLEDIMGLVDYTYIVTKLDKMEMPSQEILVARQELLENSKEDLVEAKLFLNEIKKEYNKIVYSRKQKTSI